MSWSRLRRTAEALLNPRTFLVIASATLITGGYGLRLRADGLRLDLVNPEILGERLREGDVDAKERQPLIERLFSEAGCEIARQPIDKKSANVICDLPGQTTTRIVVGAHFDFADEGQGIVDDWSGTSMLVSLYQTLKSEVPKHSFEFVAFAGEERGLLGSNRYVKELGAGPSTMPEAFVNLECLGLTPPKVWVSRSSPVLVRPLIEVANAMHVSVSGVNVDRVGDDDTHPFLSKKIPVISIHSVTQDKWAILHSTRDNVRAINFADFYDAYRLVAFYLDYLDTRLPSSDARVGSPM